MSWKNTIDKYSEDSEIKKMIFDLLISKYNLDPLKETHGIPLFYSMTNVILSDLLFELSSLISNHPDFRNQIIHKIEEELQKDIHAP